MKTRSVEGECSSFGSSCKDNRQGTKQTGKMNKKRKIRMSLRFSERELALVKKRWGGRTKNYMKAEVFKQIKETIIKVRNGEQTPPQKFQEQGCPYSVLTSLNLEKTLDREVFDAWMNPDFASIFKEIVRRHILRFAEKHSSGWTIKPMTKTPVAYSALAEPFPTQRPSPILGDKPDAGIQHAPKGLDDSRFIDEPVAPPDQDPCLVDERVDPPQSVGRYNEEGRFIFYNKK